MPVWAPTVGPSPLKRRPPDTRFESESRSLLCSCPWQRCKRHWRAGSCSLVRVGYNCVKACSGRPCCKSELASSCCACQVSDCSARSKRNGSTHTHTHTHYVSGSSSSRVQNKSEAPHQNPDFMAKRCRGSPTDNFWTTCNLRLSRCSSSETH